VFRRRLMSGSSSRSAVSDGIATAAALASTCSGNHACPWVTAGVLGSGEGAIFRLDFPHSAVGPCTAPA
jgi:hypothetical protein